MKSIYVDTTFCTPEAFHIPNRSECIDAAAALIAEWLQRSGLNVVFMSCSARYGYEHLLMELSAKLNMKVFCLTLHSCMSATTILIKISIEKTFIISNHDNCLFLFNHSCI